MTRRALSRYRLGGFLLALVVLFSVAAPQASAATAVRVMTWNIHGEAANIAGVASVIKANGVDIVTVQEIHRRPEWDQVRELAATLGWHLTTNVHFGRADNPGPCDDPWPGDAGNAVLTAFPIVERVTKPLSPASQDCPVRRSMAGVKVDVNGTALRVFTSHFTPGHGSAAVTLRQQQARTVIDYLIHSGPLLFTGDLNDVPGSTIHRWFAGAGFLDTGGRFADDPTPVPRPGGSGCLSVDPGGRWQGGGRSSYRVVFGPSDNAASGRLGRGETSRILLDGAQGTARIDYIFARAVTVTGGFVPDPGYSDHRPVIMDIVV